MHKLNAITGALMGTTLALGLIGYVDGFLTRDELIALVGAIVAGILIMIKLTKEGQ